VFEGFTEGDFPKIIVRISDRWSERLEFDAFDKRTGAKVVPDWLETGQHVAVRVLAKARTSDKGPWISLYVLDIQILDD
jgi:hypothetical protein